MQKKLSKVVRESEKTFTDSIGVEQYVFTGRESNTTKNDIKQKAKDFDMLMSSLKETMQSIKSRDEKISISTLKPTKSWSIHYTADYFDTSRHYVKRVCY